MKLETVIKNYKLLSQEDKLKFQKENNITDIPWYCGECEQYILYLEEIKQNKGN